MVEYVIEDGVPVPAKPALTGRKKGSGMLGAIERLQCFAGPSDD